MSSLIRNYLGFPRGISGRRLAEEAYEQAWVFGARFAFMQEVTGLRADGDRIMVGLSDFPDVGARAVILAAGAAYRRLEVEEIEALAATGAGVFYGGPAAEAPAMAGRDVFVVGGANSAGQAALHLADYARRVTLVVRADSLAAGMSHYLVEQVEASPNIEVRLGTEVVGGKGEGWLEELELRDRGEGTVETAEAHALFLMIGPVRMTLSRRPREGCDLRAARGWCAHVLRRAGNGRLDELDGARFTGASQLRRLAELPSIRSVSALGLRNVARAEVEGMRELGAGWATTRELIERGPEELVSELVPGDVPLYVSIDLDVLDLSLVPGTTLPEPGGLSYRQLRATLAAVARRGRIVAIDVAELNPPYDHSGTTARTATWTITHLLSEIFEARAGR